MVLSLPPENADFGVWLHPVDETLGTAIPI